jgi:hypothetical protein
MQAPHALQMDPSGLLGNHISALLVGWGVPLWEHMRVYARKHAGTVRLEANRYAAAGYRGALTNLHPALVTR